MAVRALALLLALLMTPATAELIETGVHIVEHGDLGHLGADPDAPLGGDEHGCTAVFHVCGCHASTVMPSVASIAAADPDAHRTPTTLAPHDELGCGRPPPPIRPPKA